MAGKLQKSASSKRLKRWQWLAYLVIAGLLVYAVDAQFGHFRRGVSALAGANPALALVAVALTALTFFIAAGIYFLLALHKLKYWRTLAVELAAALATRLLPAGLGGLGLHGDYLHREKHSLAEATAVISVNNALGIIANVILLILALAIWPDKIGLSKFHISAGLLLAALAGLLLLIIIVVSVRRIRLAISSFARNFARSLKVYARRPHKIVLALALAMALTLAYTATLAVSASAVNVQLNFGAMLVIFSIGTLVGTATPTPGGLVGVEAGLFAGFTAYGIASTPALAAVFLFRLITYWGPLAPGAVALILARRKKLI